MTTPNKFTTVVYILTDLSSFWNDKNIYGMRHLQKESWKVDFFAMVHNIYAVICFEDYDFARFICIWV